MARPVIGLTTSLIQAKWSVWNTTAALVDFRYVKAITLAGGLPVLLPPTDSEEAAHIIERLDGICFIGGADINPELYGARPHHTSSPATKELDLWQLELMKATIEQKLPFIAICRGLQILNVAKGGTLHQHLPDIVGHELHRPIIGKKTKHPVRIAEDSVLYPILGTHREVVTYHHQGPDLIGEGLIPIAWAEDGVVEGLHLVDHPWGVGVHWHPEEDDTPLLKEFINAARLFAPAAIRRIAYHHQ